MKDTLVYDNGGRSLDRYTIIFTKLPEGHDDQGRTLFASLGLSEDPNWGFSQWGLATIGSHLGHLISFEDLPDNVKEHAKRRGTE